MADVQQPVANNILPLSVPASQPFGQTLSTLLNIKRQKLENQAAGQGLVQQQIQIARERAALKQNLTDLDQNHRRNLSTVLGSFVGSDRPNSEIVESLENYGLEHPEAMGVVHFAENMLARNGKDPKSRDAFLNQAVKAVINPESLGGMQAPQAGVISTGGAQNIVQTNPQAPGGIQQLGALQNTLTPSEQLPRFMPNAAGQQIYANPVNPTQAGIVGGGNPQIAPTSPDVAARTDISRAGAQSFAGNVNAAAQVPMARNALQNIIKLSDQVTTGPETDRINKLKAMAGNFIPGAQSWKDSSSAYQEMTKYMEQYALRAWSAAGGTGTNEQYEAQKMANPNNQYNSEAVKNLAEWALAGQDAAQAKANAMIQWAKKPGNGPQNSLEFENAWANALDPRAFQVEHMTPAEIKKTFNKKERDEIRGSIQRLQQFNQGLQQ